MYMHLFPYVVPSPTVEVTSIDAVELGESATLECNATVAREITSRVDIRWITMDRFNSYTRVRTVENVTASIMNDLAIYTDKLVTPSLSVNDRGRTYYCEVIINNGATNAFDTIILDFTSTYVHK